MSHISDAEVNFECQAILYTEQFSVLIIPIILPADCFTVALTFDIDSERNGQCMSTQESSAAVIA